MGRTSYQFTHVLIYRTIDLRICGPVGLPFYPSINLAFFDLPSFRTIYQSIYLSTYGSIDS